MAVKPRAELNAYADANFPDNDQRAIQEEHLRTGYKHLADSALLAEDIATPSDIAAGTAGKILDAGHYRRIARLSVEDFGVGVSNDAVTNTTALLAMRDELAAETDRHFEILLPAGRLQYQSCRWLQGIRSYQLIGGPTQLKNTLTDQETTTERVTLMLNQDVFSDYGGSIPGEGIRVWGSLIETVKRGETSVALVESGESSAFSEGSWALVYGYNQASNGYPPSIRYFEYKIIKSIAGGVISFYEPLRFTYRADWHDLANIIGEAQTLGAARILSLDRAGFQMCEYARLADLEFLPSFGAVEGVVSTLSGSLFAFSAIKVLGERLRVHGYMYPSVSDDVEFHHSYFRFIEVDRLLDNILFHDCDIEEISNGPATNLVRVNGGRVRRPITSINCRRFVSVDTEFDMLSETLNYGANVAPSCPVELAAFIRPKINTIDAREDLQTAPDQTGMSSTQIKLAASSSADDDHYNGMQVSVLSGTGVYQIRTISDYVGATKIATISAAWTTQPDATSVYRLDRALPLTSGGGTVSLTVIGVTTPNKITTSFGGVGDTKVRGLDVGSLLKSTTTTTQIKVSAIYYDGENTVIEGQWLNGTPGAGETFVANHLRRLQITAPDIIGTQPYFRSNQPTIPLDLASNLNVDEYEVESPYRVGKQITFPFVFFRDKTGGAGFRSNIEGRIRALEVYIETAYSGALGTATLTITRPSGEGTTPMTEVIDLKTVGGRRVEIGNAGTALGGDSLEAVVSAFWHQISLQASGDFSDGHPAGHVTVELQ